MKNRLGLTFLATGTLLLAAVSACADTDVGRAYVLTDLTGSVAEGDRVVGLVVLPCGSCSRCLAGDPSNCLNWWRHPERAYARYRKWGWYRVGWQRPGWDDAPRFDVLMRDLPL